MNILPEIIASFSKEESRNYKLIVNRTNALMERKDRQLFDLVKKNYSEDYDEDVIFKEIYGNTGNKNAFYRLKHKVLEDLGLSLLFLYADVTDTTTTLKDIFLAQVFFQKSAWSITNYYLNKAEKRAAQANNYELLDLIYSEFIKLSHEVLDVDPEEYIQKRSENKQRIDELRELDNVLSVITYKIRKSQNFNTKHEPINALLDDTIKRFANRSKNRDNPQFNIKIYHAISKALLSKQDYPALESYLLKTFHQFTKQNWFTKNNHDTKLQMLTYICNTLFKNKKLKDSLKYAAVLKTALSEYNDLWYDKYVYYYYNALVINYSELDINKAIEFLNESLTVKAITTHPIYLGYVYLNLAALYFDTKQYKPSLKSLVKLTQNPNYNRLDVGFRLKIEIAELILRYETDDFNYVNSKARSIKKVFRTELAEEGYIYDNDFIKVITLMATENGLLTAKVVKAKIRQYIKTHQTNEKQPVEVINYIDWLTNKVR